MKTKLSVVALLLGVAVPSFGLQFERPVLQLDTRFDYEYTLTGDKNEKNRSRFEGRYLNIILHGNIGDKFSYHFRQRLNVPNSDNPGIFKSTDWLYLTYTHNKKISVSAGKQVVAIGGYEYDRAPIDLYFCSVFWNHIACYQIGVTLTLKDNTGKNSILLQAVNSPFGNSMYAYNLLWAGNLGWFNTLYSVNLLEYQKGKYINYIALGNKIKVGGCTLEFDFMNRATRHQTFFFKDMSLIGDLSYRINGKFRAFAKCGYDVNKAGNPTLRDDAGNPFDRDQCVAPGTDLFFYGAGAEYFPLKNENVRIHAVWHSNTQKPVNHFFNIGVRWKIDIL